jgi:hypothetical protein
MTVPALIILSLLTGATVSYGARIQIRTLQRHAFSTRYFSGLMMLQIMVVMPLGGYFYAFYPDWSWMYLVNSQQINLGVVIMALVSYPLAAAMGYLVGYYSSRSGSDWVTVMFITFMFIGLIGLFAVAYNQLLNVGTYNQYHRNVGLKLIYGTSLFPSVLLALSGLAVSWGYLVYRFIQEGHISLRAF